jgi:LUD domain
MAVRGHSEAIDHGGNDGPQQLRSHAVDSHRRRNAMSIGSLPQPAIDCAVGEAPALPALDDSLVRALAARGFDAQVVPSAEAARERILELLPDGALVSHGGSTTLEQIGLPAALRGSDRLRYGNAEWSAEDNAERRTAIRKHNSIFADVFLGSVQAVARTGQVVGCDAGGSRQGPYVWGPRRVIWVAGANKVVANLDAALRRVYQVALPLEDARIREAGDAPGSSVNKLVIYEREPLPGRTTVILVEAPLGF